MKYHAINQCKCNFPVARLMRAVGIQGKMLRRKRPRTTVSDTSHPVAPNRLNREFTGKKRHEVWLDGHHLRCHT
jgi:transposase InsO family protein